MPKIDQRNEYKKSVIFTDSKSALYSINKKGIIANRCNLTRDIRSLYFELINEGYKLEFCWIPSHRGISGNELADFLAKSSRELPLSQYSSPFRDYINPLKISLNRKWQSLWSNSSSYTRYFSLHPVIPTKIWFFDPKVRGRRFITSIIRIKTAHNSSPSHLFKIKATTSPFCSCGFYGDINHLFFDCYNYIDKCKNLYSSLISLGHFAPISIFSVLSTCTINTYFILFSFMSSTNLKI